MLLCQSVIISIKQEKDRGVIFLLLTGQKCEFLSAMVWWDGIKLYIQREEFVMKAEELVCLIHGFTD